MPKTNPKTSSTTRTLERRYLPAKEFRVKRSDSGAATLEGYAAVFNSLSEDFGGWREQLAPGCFTSDLATQPDVRALVNHDPNLILGRTKANTLTLAEDATGLRFECNLPDTQAARDLATSIDRGDIDQCSFGMYVEQADWGDLADGSTVRTIKIASLFDVSAVTYPAYTATSVSVRSLFPDGVPPEVRSHIPATRTNENGCDCDCPECVDDNCADCSDPECVDPNCQQERSLRKANLDAALLRVRISQAL
jgi:HK97 family phage prohead protease